MKCVFGSILQIDAIISNENGLYVAAVVITIVLVLAHALAHRNLLNIFYPRYK